MPFVNSPQPPSAMPHSAAAANPRRMSPPPAQSNSVAGNASHYHSNGILSPSTSLLVSSGKYENHPLLDGPSAAAASHGISGSPRRGGAAAAAAAAASQQHGSPEQSSVTSNGLSSVGHPRSSAAVTPTNSSYSHVDYSNTATAVSTPHRANPASSSSATNPYYPSSTDASASSNTHNNNANNSILVGSPHGQASATRGPSGQGIVVPPIQLMSLRSPSSSVGGGATNISNTMAATGSNSNTSGSNANNSNARASNGNANSNEPLFPLAVLSLPMTSSTATTDNNSNDNTTSSNPLLAPIVGASTSSATSSANSSTSFYGAIAIPQPPIVAAVGGSVTGNSSTASSSRGAGAGVGLPANASSHQLLKDEADSSVNMAPHMITARNVAGQLMVDPVDRKRQRSILLREEDVKIVLTAVREVFMAQPMLLEVKAPMKVCGDIHGQFYDLLRIFEKCGLPPDANYLFLGDYVDRGKHSIETIMLMFCYKLLYPEKMWLLRGNHECAAVTKNYGFMDDVKRKYNIRLWKQFTDVFNTMPCCAVISEKIICMHGGLSPDLTEVQLVNRIQRPCDVPDRGILCDVLWSDPDTDGNLGFLPSSRGVGYTFGEDIVSDFLDMVDMDLIVRAHEVMERGYAFFADRQLVTIFSAPNYCGEFENDGAVMVVDAKLQCSFAIIRGGPDPK